MTTTKRLARKSALGVLALAALLGMACTPVGKPVIDPQPVATIEEDEPGWNCHTMGNRVCGPVAQ